MRINKYIASASTLSRRAADAAILDGRITVNGHPAGQGLDVNADDVVMLDGRRITPIASTTTILFNKPVGYVVSRNGQGSDTIYDILPLEYQQLQPVGRLDKDSSGLLLLTNDGELANQLTHPSYQKTKVYQITLNKGLEPQHQRMISEQGVQLDDGLSRLQLQRMTAGEDRDWLVTMHEGRNRQIRRTFTALHYKVATLHRIQFGAYSLQDLGIGTAKIA